MVQLYQNQRAGHTGTLSLLSTLHILLLSIHYLVRLPPNNSKIRTILVVCLVTNAIQLGQCWMFWDETLRVVEEECGTGGGRVFVVSD